MLLAAILATAMVTPYAVVQSTNDWSSCKSHLDDLKSKSDDGSSAAGDLDDANEKLRKCIRDPEWYDTWKDGCQKQKRDYRDSLDGLHSKFTDIESALKSVESSCEFKFFGVRHSPENTCALIREQHGVMSYEFLLKTCTTYMGEEGCKKCLSLP